MSRKRTQGRPFSISQRIFEHDVEFRVRNSTITKAATIFLELRIKNGSVDVTDGPYAETKEMLGGILLLEARDLNHAIALMSQHPGVKVGPIEIRPADEETNKLIAARNVTLRSDPTNEKLQSSPCSTLRAALNFSYEWIKPLAEDLADSPMISPTPTHGNHPLWVMGHLVFSSGGLLSMISGEANPFGEWRELFSGGTTPQIDGAIYPKYVDVLQAYERVHEDVLRQLDNLPVSRLGERPPAVWEEVREDPHFQFTVMGVPCIGLNGGPGVEHNWAFSFQVATEDQAETDRYWNAIVADGGQESQCGWCKDRWGVNWQITPIILTKAFSGPDRAAAKRAFDAMMTMKKIDIAAVEAAIQG